MSVEWKEVSRNFSKYLTKQKPITMAEKMLKKEDLDQATDYLVEQSSYKGWELVKIELVPKEFDKQALKMLLHEANSQAMKLIAKAVGIAFIRQHDEVSREDVENAILMQDKDYETIIPKPQYGFGNRSPSPSN